MEAWPSETAEYSLKILLPLPRQNQCKRLLLQCTLSSTSTRHQHLLPCSPLLVVPVLFGKSGHLQNASIRSWLSTGRIPAVVNHCPIRPKADLVSHSSLPLQELWAGSALLSTQHCPGATPSTKGRVSEHSDHVAQDQFSSSVQGSLSTRFIHPIRTAQELLLSTSGFQLSFL